MSTIYITIGGLTSIILAIFAFYKLINSIRYRSAQDLSPALFFLLIGLGGFWFFMAAQTNTQELLVQDRIERKISDINGLKKKLNSQKLLTENEIVRHEEEMNKLTSNLADLKGQNSIGGFTKASLSSQISKSLKMLEQRKENAEQLRCLENGLVNRIGELDVVMLKANNDLIKWGAAGKEDYGIIESYLLDNAMDNIIANYNANLCNSSSQLNANHTGSFWATAQ